MPASIEYAVGGTVQSGGGQYISRSADDELLSLCREGKFAYVLTPRQMGKSSLMIRTGERLAEENIRSVIIDLTQFGTQASSEQWYLGFLFVVAEQLKLDVAPASWWQAHSQLGQTQRLIEFFERVVLESVSQRLVVFIDEIDTTLGLPHSDDFYAALRFFYNHRAIRRAFNRLSFVFLGVATPGDLIRDPARTPFNIGARVELDDFDCEQAKPLAAGLGLPDDQTDLLLSKVLYWTGGHPFLTQRLFRDISSTLAESGKIDVDRIAAETFFEKSGQDINLQFVTDMLTKRIPAGIPEGEVIETYREIRLGKREVPDDAQNIVKAHLKLSGLVKPDKQKCLRLRNRIYSRTFDGIWIRDHLPPSWWKKLKRASPFAALGLIAIGAVYGVVELTAAMQQVEETKRQVQDVRLEAKQARINMRNSQTAAAAADRRVNDAEVRLKDADMRLKDADRQLKDADVRLSQADLRVKETERNKTLAESAAALALKSLGRTALEALKLANLENTLQLATYDEDPKTQANAVESLRSIGGNVIAPLNRIIENESLPWEQRVTAAKVLGGMKEPGFGTLLSVSKQHPDSDFKQLAVLGMVASLEEASPVDGRSAALDVMEQLTHDPDAIARNISIWGLSQFAMNPDLRTKACGILDELAKDGDKEVRDHAMEILHQIGR